MYVCIHAHALATCAVQKFVSTDKPTHFQTDLTHLTHPLTHIPFTYMQKDRERERERERAREKERERERERVRERPGGISASGRGT